MEEPSGESGGEHPSLYGYWNSDRHWVRASAVTAQSLQSDVQLVSSQFVVALNTQPRTVTIYLNRAMSEAVQIQLCVDTSYADVERLCRDELLRNLQRTRRRRKKSKRSAPSPKQRAQKDAISSTEAMQADEAAGELAATKPADGTSAQQASDSGAAEQERDESAPATLSLPPPPPAAQQEEAEADQRQDATAESGDAASDDDSRSGELPPLPPLPVQVDTVDEASAVADVADSTAMPLTPRDDWAQQLPALPATPQVEISSVQSSDNNEPRENGNAVEESQIVAKKVYYFTVSYIFFKFNDKFSNHDLLLGLQIGRTLLRVRLRPSKHAADWQFEFERTGAADDRRALAPRQLRVCVHLPAARVAD